MQKSKPAMNRISFPVKNKNQLKDWEIRIIQTTDVLNFVGDFNVIIALIVLNIIGFGGINIHFFIVFALSFFVFVANRLGKYIISSYLFFAIGNYLLSIAVLMMGIDTYALMYFFPITMSVVQIMGRKETYIHLVIWLIIYFINIVLLLTFADLYTKLPFDDASKQILVFFNVILAFFCGITIIGVITWNAINLENSIRKNITEKEVLLAEIFHRVKNNLNLVTSLLNIRKNKSNSPEVAEALEDCRNRVFSMALVHDKLYAENHLGQLNLNEFINDLLHSIELNLGEEAEINVFIDEEIYLSITKSVPTGLILNELFTNMYKHGKVEDRQLVVKLYITKVGKELTIQVCDNGPGISPKKEKGHNLGLELIDSLTEQLDGEFSLVTKDYEAGAKAILKFNL